MSVQGQRALTLYLGEERWALQGGWQEPGLLGIRLAVLSGEDVIRYQVRIPVASDGEDLLVGDPIVVEGWPPE